MRAMRISAAGLVAVVLSTSGLSAQAPTSGWRAEFLDSFGSLEKKFTALAEATPWDKYNWRPGTDVRSVCEVFMHIAGDNYLLAGPLGAQTPANIDMKAIEKCPANKDVVASTMKASFAHFRDAVTALPDADADVKVKFFGRDVTKRGLLLATAEHAGEHLGQSIAYARMNGIVPPWSRKTQ